MYPYIALKWPRIPGKFDLETPFSYFRVGGDQEYNCNDRETRKHAGADGIGSGGRRGAIAAKSVSGISQRHRVATATAAGESASRCHGGAGISHPFSVGGNGSRGSGHTAAPQQTARGSNSGKPVCHACLEGQEAMIMKRISIGRYPGNR